MYAPFARASWMNFHRWWPRSGCWCPRGGSASTARTSRGPCRRGAHGQPQAVVPGPRADVHVVVGGPEGVPEPPPGHARLALDVAERPGALVGPDGLAAVLVDDLPQLRGEDVRAPRPSRCARTPRSPSAPPASSDGGSGQARRRAPGSGSPSRRARPACRAAPCCPATRWLSRPVRSPPTNTYPDNQGDMPQNLQFHPVIVRGPGQRRASPRWRRRRPRHVEDLPVHVLDRVAELVVARVVRTGCRRRRTSGPVPGS